MLQGEDQMIIKEMSVNHFLYLHIRLKLKACIFY